MSTLFQIGEDAQALMSILEELEGDVSDPAVAEAIDAWLTENQQDLNTKLDGYGALMAELDARAAAREAEAKRLMELAQVGRNKVKAMKARLKTFFEIQNLSKVETGRYRFSLVANGGARPVVLRDGVTALDLPEEFQITTPAINTAAIRDALEAGEELDFATFGPRGTHIRVK